MVRAVLVTASRWHGETEGIEIMMDSALACSVFLCKSPNFKLWLSKGFPF